MSLSVYLPYAIGTAVVLGQLYKAISQKRAPDYDVERVYWKPNGETGLFPSVDDKASLLVSVVVPAYNEDKRMAPMMTAMLEHLQAESKKDKNFTWEIIIVDDGSKDKTSTFANNTYVRKLTTDKVRVLRLFRNNGKGGAVRKGMVRARGQYILMADADGATQASDLARLLAELRKVERDGLGIAVGSRAHLEVAEDPKARRSVLRKFLMWGFHTLITVMLGSSQIHDTQCGFKLFTRETARRLFFVQHIDRWAFDVELLFLAGRKGVPLVEVPVTWNEIDGSKLDVLDSTIQMARDIFAIRLCYMTGVWSAERPPAAVENTAKDPLAHVQPDAE